MHGCFWHGHEGCRGSHVPATRSNFWKAKFERNRDRDRRQAEAAKTMGWETLVVWECETRDRDQGELTSRLTRFIGPQRRQPDEGEDGRG